MTPIPLTAKPLTPDAFAAYGDVIEAAGPVGCIDAVETCPPD